MFVAHFDIQGDIDAMTVTNTKVEAEYFLAKAIMERVDDFLCHGYKHINREFTKRNYR